ncbi:MAG: beta-ketoacyl-ACP reductase [Lysobacterales bacterium 69-70]|nr:acetoacetyl-CoA reductase [Xanthomonadaceae bacterium]ODU33197.1 MAG: beta-ketoacyl-ACP reductase [Xanthomonadaceae bacterium SCN 69-320]ODV20476.1 MAG: beta-ketoacyl-ACP reductase [Xanthomonadaceae bacterium SCN 69-25]OJZ00742.1 MAG: beta-ketoacyl-ACP reductase [Xanthomonadales bacterium 69-70]
MSRTALVTGGTRGIGRAIAEALHADGHTVAVTYHGDETHAAAFRRETGIAAYRWDVADFAACASGVAEVEAALGPIGILVNNAGIVRDAPLHRMSQEQWSQVIATDLDSLFNMCRQVIGGMRERGFGRIVNVGSVNAQKGQFGQTNYAAAKAGVIGFTKALALESARCGITVNCIAPGYCDTDMLKAVREDVMASIIAAIPVGRLGTPAEVARAVRFLAGEDAGFITGATLALNGGQYLS